MTWRTLLPALLVSVLLVGCAPYVSGNIPPTTFQFTTVVEPDRDPKGSGWQVAQVVVLLGHLSSLFPRSSTCDIEVGVPIVNKKQGYISLERAQRKSATAADNAAQRVLGERVPTALACIRFREYMEISLQRNINGARVAAFKWSNVPRVPFPDKRKR